MEILNSLTPDLVGVGYDKARELTLQEFDSNAGYYSRAVVPKMEHPNSDALSIWLRDSNLIPQSHTCGQCMLHRMTWTKRKVRDHFQWRCDHCGLTAPVREHSVFENLRCNFSHTLRIFSGWCRGYDSELMAKLLCIKVQVVDMVYAQAATVVSKCMEVNVDEWQLGGRGSIVLVDTYCEGFAKFGRLPNVSNPVPILCLAEAEDRPPKYWFQVLDRYNPTNPKDVKKTNDTALETIQQFVRPGSVLVVNLTTAVCSYEVLQSLRHLYPLIVTYEGLQRHDSQLQSALNNLETIWEEALGICEEAQYFTRLKMKFFLCNRMWVRKFGEDAFEMLLEQLKCDKMPSPHAIFSYLENNLSP